MEEYLTCNEFSSLVPAPVVVVGAYKDDGQPNFSVVGAAATVCSAPPILSIGFRPATLSHSLLLNRKEFTVGIVSASRISEIDYVGTRPGATEDKAASVGWPTAKASKVNAPYSPVFGLVYQCKLVDSITFRSHTLFFGEIVEADVRNDCVGEGGVPSIEKLEAVLFNRPGVNYVRVGEKLAPAFVGKRVS
jgi:flavin reductase (DIM6/NTAB) family NADH-FMN oxidoreductase RutF